MFVVSLPDLRLKYSCIIWLQLAIHRPQVGLRFGIKLAIVLKEIGFWTDFQDEEQKVEVEAKGQLRYRLEYDFTTQELKITVSPLRLYVV